MLRYGWRRYATTSDVNTPRRNRMKSLFAKRLHRHNMTDNTAYIMERKMTVRYIKVEHR